MTRERKQSGVQHEWTLATGTQLQPNLTTGDYGVYEILTRSSHRRRENVTLLGPKSLAKAKTAQQVSARHYRDSGAKKMATFKSTTIFLLIFTASAFGGEEQSGLARSVTEHYVTQARERYQAALDKALALEKAVRIFVSNSSPETHETAKQAWLEAHRVYCSTEVFRFGNPNVDAWEGRVNAWPVDEGYIDYVNEEHYHPEESNRLARLNYIANPNFPVGDEAIDALYDEFERINANIKVIDFETNVARGFHAIEFLLWGQDLNLPGDIQPGGKRPYTDYIPKSRDPKDTAVRRGAYLRACVDLLIFDLRRIIIDWKPKPGIKSIYATAFLDLPIEERLNRMLIGMGSLCYGELAGERIQVALLASDQEDEQNCFSDTTHLVIADNANSIETVYRGVFTYSSLEGPSLADLVKKLDPELDAKLQRQMKVTRDLVNRLHSDFFLKRNEPFDRMILPDNQAGQGHLRAIIDSLAMQTELLESVKAMIPSLANI